jgi:Cys-tRNA(Pro)/Cys-tRNA(Cys) deacylase
MAMAKHDKPIKTNAMRALDARHIPYDLFTYPDTIHSAEEVAGLLGVPPERVYKTLVMQTGEGQAQANLLMMAPGGATVDPRLLARSLGVKAVRMAPQREAERLTGLLVGGISPLALLDKRFAVYLDARAQAFERIYLNGGQRGVNLCLRVADLVAVTGARFVDATQPPGPQP